MTADVHPDDPSVEPADNREMARFGWVQIASGHRTVPRFESAEQPKWCDFESAQ